MKLLSSGEMARGAALLVPLIPPWAGGVGLIAFSSGLLRLYVKVPGMREDSSLRPTPQGMGIAKDSWLLAIGLALVLGSLQDD